MMWHMVPRLWNYQVELPPRTVAHLMLGITIGVLILVKIAILRFFRHFEESMPYLGTALLLCTYLLIGLSVPFTLREAALRTQTGAFSEAGIARTRQLLETAGLPPDAPLDELASKRKLREGKWCYKPSVLSVTIYARFLRNRARRRIGRASSTGWR